MTTALAEPTILLEPVSPELVLVDPELARRERARLTTEAMLPGRRVRPRPGVSRSEVEPRPIPPPERGTAFTLPHEWIKGIGAGIGVAALMGLGLSAAFIVTNHGAAPSVPARVARTATPLPKRQLAGALTSPELVGQKILGILAARPPVPLPRALVDPRTGLLKTNDQVTCKRRGSEFECIVRPLLHHIDEGLRVEYRFGGSRSGVFIWHPYRRG